MSIIISLNWNIKKNFTVSCVLLTISEISYLKLLKMTNVITILKNTN